MSASSPVKKTPEHYDIFGRKIEVGSFVVSASSITGIVLCKVIKLNPKMVKISKVGGRAEYNRYPSEVCLVEGEDVTMYVLSKT